MLAVGSECSPCQQFNFISLFLCLGLIFARGRKSLLSVGQRIRAGARAVDLGGQTFIREVQSLKFSTKAAVFKKESLLNGGASMSIGGLGLPWRRAFNAC